MLKLAPDRLARPFDMSDPDFLRALVESRQRFQDLVALSGDVGFECDNQRRFVFVSDALLGWAPHDLLATSFPDLLVEDDAGELFAPADRVDAKVPCRTALGGTG